VTRLAFLLADLPAELLGRLRSDRVLYFPARPGPPVTTVTQTTRYGTAVAQSRDRLHPG
jgi:hypothetical protein